MGTIPVFRTWVAGELVTANFMNGNIRDGGNFFLALATFQARQTTAQSLANLSNVPILFDTETIDSDNGHSTSTNTDRYVGKTAGYHQVQGGVGFANNVTGLRGAMLFVNGAVLLGSSQKVAAFNGTCAITTRSMYVGFNGTTDYCQVAGIQTSGGALNTAVGTEDASSMSVHWVRT